MIRRRVLRRFIGIAAILAFAAAAYSFLWAISSFSLSFADCGGENSINASTFRCQRATWLSYAFWAFVVASAALTMAWLSMRSADRDVR